MTITPSQTVGPFFAYCMTPAAYGFPELASNDLAAEDAVGERIRFEGVILDGDGAPVPDAMVELWQADGEGRYPGAGPETNRGFTGFGRAECDAAGRFGFSTVRPGPVRDPGLGLLAPHLNLGIFARGVLRRLYTRAYFEGETANEADPVLALVPPERRSTLIARRQGPARYALEIRLRGEGETVFFEA